MNPVGAAVIGAGYWGPNIIRNMLASDAVALKWVCDLDVARALRALSGRNDIAVTTELADVLDDPEVEAVAIATPATTHAELALTCLEAGRHVWIEKPLASSAADGEKLVRSAERLDMVLMCDHTYCYTPAVQRIRDICRNGALGDIQYFDSVRINLGIVQSDVDVIWDLAPHDLSILDFILPEQCVAEAVTAHGADPIGAGHVSIGYLTLPLSTGGIAHVHVNWLSPVKVRTTIVGGSRRMLVWDDLHPSQRLSMYDKGVQLNGSADRESRLDALVSYRIGDMVAPALLEREALGAAVEEFATAIREGRPALTDGRSGLRVLQMLEAASLSLQSDGRPVTLDLTR